MSVGDSWTVEFLKQEDSETGALVERLSDHAGDTFHPYFLPPVISDDGRYLLLANNRSGAPQIHVLDVPAARMVQLTDGPGVRGGGSCMDPRQGIVYYWSAGRLMSVAIEGGESNQHYVCPEGYRPTGLSISACGRYLAFAYFERLPASTESGKIYSSQAERLFQCPRSVLIRLDLHTGRPQALYGETQWYTHVNISPADPNIVMFCHEGPWLLVQRMWIARADTMEVWPLLKTRRLLEQCGHEYFTVSGRVVTQYAQRETVTQQPWRHANVLLDPDGTDERRYWYEGPQPMHVQTSHRDEALMVGDCGQRRDFDDAEGGARMSLIRLVDDRSEMTTLCRHDTSWTRQHSHPHPVFWPDDRWVLFNSDHGGRCNVYRVETGV